MPIKTSSFGSVKGTEVFLYEMTNVYGHRVCMTNFGAILVSVEVPDRDGKLENVNLGYSDLAGYLERHPYLGSTVGRFCNRIAAGKFELDGKTYTLAINNGPNHLHGGIEGFDRHIWEVEQLESEHGCGLRMTTVSPDGEEGYPGKLNVVSEYTWNNSSELSYTFRATTDAPTVLNLTNHAYWNLAGVGKGDIRDHELKLNCANSLAVDEDLIPTGKVLPTAGSSLDFADFRRLGERLDEFVGTKGYDHCYVVDGEPGNEPRLAGTARDTVSGRVMEVLTTQPGMQLYTGNHLDGDFAPYTGFCLETQHFPDAPNKPEFPTTRLDPGQEFVQKTIHRFSIN